MTSSWTSLHAIYKLIRLRVRLWWNTFKHSSRAKKILYALLVLGMLVFGGFLLAVSWGAVYLMSSEEVNQTLQQAGVGFDLNSIVERLPVFALEGIFLAGILTTFGGLLQTLYLSGDTEFLLTAPIPARSVFASKLLQAAFPGLVFLGLLTLPALIGLGLSQGYHVLYFVLVPVTVVMLVLSAAGLSSILVMAVVRVLPPRRAAEIIGVIGGTIAILFSQIGQFTGNFEGSPDRVLRTISALDITPTPLNPLTWPGLGLSGIGNRDWASGGLFVILTLVSTTALVGFSMVLAERLYFSGWSRVQMGTTSRKRQSSRKEERARGGSTFSRFLPAPVVALIAKDFRMYRRDLRNLSQLVTPILFAVIWTFTLDRPGRALAFPGSTQTFGDLGAVGIALFVGWMFAIRFGMGGISSEGKQWWIIKSSPLMPGNLLLAKYLLALLPTLALSLVYFVLISLIRSAEPVAVLYNSVAIALVTAAECSLLLAFGVWTARFDWDNPRQINSGIGGCLGTIATMVFIGMGAGLFIGLPALAPLIGIPLGVGLVVGVVSGLAFCLAIGVVPLWVAKSKVPMLGDL